MQLNDSELQILKEKRLKEKKFWLIIREISVYSTFLFALYVVAFTNATIPSFEYQRLFIKTFSKPVNTQKLFKVYTPISLLCTINVNFCDLQWFKQRAINKGSVKNTLGNNRHMIRFEMLKNDDLKSSFVIF